MDFVAIHGWLATKHQVTTHIPQLLFALKRRFGIQKTQAQCRAAPAFETDGS